MIFEAAALFNIAMVVAALGADTGLLRFTARDLANGHSDLLRSMTVIAVVPALVASTIMAIVTFVLADPIGELFGHEFSAELADFVRAAAFTIPIGAVALVLLGGTRGHDTMAPTALLERILKPAVQIVCLLLAVALGVSWFVLGALWAVAFPIMLAASWLWLMRLRERDGGSTGELRPVAGAWTEFWTFSLPRALASMFRVGVLFLDVLLVGAMIDTRAAALYTVATRLLQMGFLVNNALGQAVEPMFSRLITNGRHDEAHRSFKVATGWSIALTWPWLLIISIFPATVLGLFGSGYPEAGTVLVILSIGAMVGVASGPVDVLLVMAGRSGLSFMNSALALGSNVVLNLVLIPKWGIEGAAIAWVISLLISNLLPLVQVRSLLGFLPFGDGWFVGALASLATFGVIAGLVRVSAGQGVGQLAVALVLAGSLYVGIMWRAKNHLDLSAFSALRPGAKSAERSLVKESSP